MKKISREKRERLRGREWIRKFVKEVQNLKVNKKDC